MDRVSIEDCEVFCCPLFDDIASAVEYIKINRPDIDEWDRLWMAILVSRNPKA